MRRTGVLMTCSLLGSLIVNNLILKNLVARTRPYEAVDGLQRIIEAQRDLSFPSGHTGSSFAAAVVIFLTCPGKIGVPALILAFLIMFFKTLCRSALSDGRSCRNDHGDTDRSAGMQGVSENIEKFRIIIYKNTPDKVKAPGCFSVTQKDDILASSN